MIEHRRYLSLWTMLPVIALSVGCKAALDDEGHQVAGCVRSVPADPYCKVSLVSLISNPKKYEGTSASVSGFMAQGVIPSALYLSRESWLSGDTASAISLGAIDKVVSESMMATDATFVTVFGSIEAQPAPRGRRPALRMNVERFVVLFNASEIDGAERKLKAVRE